MRPLTLKIIAYSGSLSYRQQLCLMILNNVGNGIWRKEKLTYKGSEDLFIAYVFIKPVIKISGEQAIVTHSNQFVVSAFPRFLTKVAAFYDIIEHLLSAHDV
jgi:hypothetical protein